MNFWKIFKNEDFCFKFFQKGQILRPFSGLAPSKLKFFQKDLRVGYVYIKETLIPFSIWLMAREFRP